LFIVDKVSLFIQYSPLRVILNTCCVWN